MNKYLNYLLILVGAIIAISAQAGDQQNTIVLILGIVVLMFGIYKLTETIPDKKNEDEDNDI